MTSEPEATARACRSVARPYLLFVLAWTLALLLLGSVVHATESSLACPDWPTCFGTMMPEMTGGIFWEHLHRLWAGALVVLFAGGVLLVRRRRPGDRGLFRIGLVGLGLLVVQSVLGGLTVLYRLPDAISTSHLAMAFLFLALLVVMVVRTGAPWRGAGRSERRLASRAGAWTGALVFVQSVAGALVRHTDAGAACPDVPLCLGRIVPPLDHPLVRLHFLHRVLGLVAAATALAFMWRVATRVPHAVPRRLAGALGIVAAVQVALGFASVAFQLRAPWVSAHTLLAAVLVALSTALAAYAWTAEAGASAGPPS